MCAGATISQSGIVSSIRTSFHKESEKLHMSGRWPDAQSLLKNRYIRHIEQKFSVAGTAQSIVGKKQLSLLQLGKAFRDKLDERGILDVFCGSTPQVFLEFE